MPDLLRQPDEVPGLLDELVHHVAHLGGTRDAIFIRRPVLEPQKRVPAANQDDPELKPQVPEAL
nr:hypothetical protein [uncultured Rhodopila sp.]